MSEESAVGNELRINNGLKPTFTWVLLAFAIGLSLRLVLLGAIPTPKMNWYWSTRRCRSQRVSTATSAVPVYSGLTGLLFFLFGPSNFLGRVLPALVGASLLLLPWLWKEQLGQKAALILCFALALDPTYLVFSRAIHGGIFAIAGLLWTLTLIKNDRPCWRVYP